MDTEPLQLNPVDKTLTLSDIWLLTGRWFSFILKKWWILFIVGLVGGAIGFLVAYFDKPRYESHLTFALDDGGGGMGDALSLAAEFGFNLGSNKNIFEGDNILTLLTSRRIIERVLLSVDTVDGKTMTMADYFIKISADSTKKNKPKKLSPKELRLQSISFPAGQPRETFTYLQDSVLKNMYKDFAEGHLHVGRPDKKLNLFEVSVISPSERFTKVFTDKLIKVATEFYVELKTKKSKSTLDVLESRVSQTRGQLNTAISSRAGIQDANLSPAFQQAQAQLQQKQVDISAYGAAYGELYKNLELARFQYLKDIPLLQIIDGADYPMQRVKKGKLMTAILVCLIFEVIAIIVLSLKFFSKSKATVNLTYQPVSSVRSYS